MTTQQYVAAHNHNPRLVDATDDWTEKDNSTRNLWKLREQAAIERVKAQQEKERAYERQAYMDMFVSFGIPFFTVAALALIGYTYWDELQQFVGMSVLKGVRP